MVLSFFESISEARQLHSDVSDFLESCEEDRKRAGADNGTKWLWSIGFLLVAAVIIYAISAGTGGSDAEHEAEIRAEAMVMMQEAQSKADRCAKDPFLDECK